MVGPDRPQMTIKYGACALHTAYLRLQAHTHKLKMCNNYCFSTARTGTRTRLSVTLYVHRLYCCDTKQSTIRIKTRPLHLQPFRFRTCSSEALDFLCIRSKSVMSGDYGNRKGSIYGVRTDRH